MFVKKLNNLFKYTLCYDALKDYRNRKAYRQWLEKDRPEPVPHIAKQMVVKSYAVKNGIRVFIETGTYLGEMVFAVKDTFDKIFSIELSNELCERARKKFVRYKHIAIINGDSAEVLPEILLPAKEPCLFWLDGHYSGGNTAKGEKETPIMEELKQICDHPVKNHVILIDDARLFTGKNDYPTIESLRIFLESRLSNYEFDVKDDIIRIYKQCS